jgi:glycosyltransferase involved in cell wall biosynthesis
VRVAFVCQHFDSVLPPHQSSIGIWTYEVARRLGADCEATVIGRRPRGGSGNLNVDGVKVELVPCLPMRTWAEASRVWNIVQPRRKPLFAHSFYALDYLAQVMRQIRRLAPDVVHLQNFPHHAPAIRRAAPNAAIILHMHCDWLVQLDRDTMARGVRAADLVVGCSGHIVAAARKHFADTGIPFAVLPNGAPVLARTTSRPVPGRVLFVGRLSPEKGVHTLLTAWPKVVAARRDARLDIVGAGGEIPREFLVDLSDDPDVLDLSRFYPRGRAFRGSYEAALRGMIPSQLAHTVTFIGQETHERVIQRCADASLLVNPSLSESFGMSLVEALATGTPIVATRAGGMPEIVQATGGGVLVQKNNPDELADAIIRLLDDPDARAELGRRGAHRVAELYSWARIAALTQGLHGKALLARRTRATAELQMPR